MRKPPSKRVVIFAAALLMLLPSAHSHAEDRTPLFQKPVKLDASGRPMYNSWELQEIQRRKRDQTKRRQKDKDVPTQTQALVRTPGGVACQTNDPKNSACVQQNATVPTAPIPLPAPSAEASAAAVDAVDNSRPVNAPVPIAIPQLPPPIQTH